MILHMISKLDRLKGYYTGKRTPLNNAISTIKPYFWLLFPLPYITGFTQISINHYLHCLRCINWIYPFNKIVSSSVQFFKQNYQFRLSKAFSASRKIRAACFSLWRFKYSKRSNAFLTLSLNCLLGKNPHWLTSCRIFFSLSNNINVNSL